MCQALPDPLLWAIAYAMTVGVLSQQCVIPATVGCCLSGSDLVSHRGSMNCSCSALRFFQPFQPFFSEPCVQLCQLQLVGGFCAWCVAASGCSIPVLVVTNYTNILNLICVDVTRVD